MKRHIKQLVSAIALVLFFLTPIIGLAQDYVSDAIEALQDNGPVYVAPDTAGTDINTAAKLQRALREGDNIVLVMLPESDGVDSDILSIVRRLSEDLGDSSIIGLSVGRDVIGYAPTLPAGVAADQMRRANSVSNDPVTALITFAQNIHLWQGENPQPTATPLPTPTPSPVQNTERKPIWIVFLGIGIALALILFLLVPRLRSLNGNVEVGASLSRETQQDLVEAKNALETIYTHTKQVTRPEIRRILEEIYSIVAHEIVGEIWDEPHRASAVTIQRIKEDLKTFSDVMRLYSQILSGHLRLAAVDADFQVNLENKFFPQVRNAFREIADQLDKDDLQQLERLVKYLSNEFKARGMS
ncbi:hypothetical protein A2976_00945 [candidate division WWE3 bacterium RIFCSPLOWO2_01_FULL_41_9]|uniref:Uncharacterized protein n=2 Tax=Katanobacteria TaxID=422282 RepID=A0A1F4VMA9_UNCKA|nr:MAG: hypothetical protein A2976_00945 [candidate division WWE3 bacterium RIFCSPLOWO2_01_FULL_41_9]